MARRYVDPDRIDPSAMLFGALERVQQEVSGLLVERDTAAARIVSTAGTHRLELDARVDSMRALAEVMGRFFAFLPDSLGREADADAVVYAASDANQFICRRAAGHYHGAQPLNRADPWA